MRNATSGSGAIQRPAGKRRGRTASASAGQITITTPFRCSRKLFKRTIEVLETLGFYCRERFYAGGEAGWGAQVLEQPVAGFVIFADVDMAPEEVTHDFDHRTIESPTELGTVGLWTALHGDSILKAGMHHLECQFDHERLTAEPRSVRPQGHGQIHQLRVSLPGLHRR